MLQFQWIFTKRYAQFLWNIYSKLTNDFKWNHRKFRCDIEFSPIFLFFLIFITLSFFMSPLRCRTLRRTDKLRETLLRFAGRPRFWLRSIPNIKTKTRTLPKIRDSSYTTYIHKNQKTTRTIPTNRNSTNKRRLSMTTNETGSRFISWPRTNRTGKTKNRASPDGTNGTTVFPEGARGAGHAGRSLYFSRRRGTGTVKPVPPAHGSARRFALNFDAKKRLTELYMVIRQSPHTYNKCQTNLLKTPLQHKF